MQAGVPDIRRQVSSGPANHVIQVIKHLRVFKHDICLLANINGKIWKSENLLDFKPVFLPYLDRGPIRLVEKIVRRIQSEFNLPYASLFESLRFALACRQELHDRELFYERMGWMGYGGVIASQWLDIPLILEVNGDHLSEFEMLGIIPRPLQLWLSWKIMNNALQRVTHSVATGEGWLERFIERWDIDPTKVSVVQSGSQIVELLDRDQLRSFQTFSKPLDPITIAYVGAFEPWHGINTLLHAFSDVIEEYNSVKLLLIGAGTELPSIKIIINELNISDYVTFTGQLSIDQIANCLVDADIGVAPYCGRVEFSGLKILDYKAAGLATIVSGENNQPVIIKHGHTGWIVPPCDENALRQAIIYLAQNYELRRQMGQAARLEAEKLHSWHNTAEQLENIFVQTIESFR
ncbi:glycosyltransferase family 4 protein [Chloroflexota bacterium]